MHAGGWLQTVWQEALRCEFARMMLVVTFIAVSHCILGMPIDICGLIMIPPKKMTLIFWKSN